MDLPSGIATTCSVALSLFDENLSTAARIKQLSEDPSFAKLARDWDAKGKVGFAAALLMESPPMKKLLEDFDTFLEVARIFITESITPPNPLVDAALVLIKQVAPEQGELHAGAAKLLRVAMAARFCVEVDGLGAFNRAKDLDQAAQAALFKPTKEFLAGLHKQGLAPRWLAEWKEYLNQLKTERAEKAAAEAAAADEEGKKNSADKATRVAPEAAEVEKEVEADDAGGGESSNAPNVSQTPLGEPRPTTATGNTAPLAPAPARATFKVGDVVIGLATKSKDEYDGHKAKILAVLSKKYKVRLLEGPLAGTAKSTHHYVFDKVKACDDAVTNKDDAEAKKDDAVANKEDADEAKGKALGGEKDANAEWKSLEDLFEA